jgi:ATPase subunit of ABC transporter with duplicated ATPase domains
VNLIATRILEVRDGSLRVFPGTYEEYVYQLQQEEGLAKEKEVPAEEEPQTISKAERYEKIKELKRAIIKVEKELDKLEEERSGLMKLFTQDPLTFDLERTRKLTRLETMIPHAESEWTRLTNELEQIDR